MLGEDLARRYGTKEAIHFQSLPSIPLRPSEGSGANWGEPSVLQHRFSQIFSFFPPSSPFLGSSGTQALGTFFSCLCVISPPPPPELKGPGTSLGLNHDGEAEAETQGASFSRKSRPGGLRPEAGELRGPLSAERWEGGLLQG